MKATTHFGAVIATLVSTLLLSGCGGSDSGEPNQKTKPIQESDVVEKYITPVDEYWFGGSDVTYVDLGDEVLISHAIALSLAGINDDGYFEYVRDHEDMRSWGAAKLTNNLVVLNQSSDLKIYNYNNDFFDLAYEADVQLETSPLQVIDNCVYYKSSESYGTAIGKTCETSGSFSQDVLFAVEGSVTALYATNEGQLLVIHSLNGALQLNLYDTEGNLLDSNSNAENLFGFDIEQIGNKFFVSQGDVIYTFNIANNSISNPQAFHEFTAASAGHGSDQLTQHGNNLISAYGDYVYYYQMSNGEVTGVLKAQVSYGVSSMFVKNDTLIVRYIPSNDSSPSISAQTFQLTELLQ